MTIYQLPIPIDVHCPLGYAKCIAWIDYGPEVNTMWKCISYEDGSVRNFYDDQIVIYPNPADGGNIVIPKGWKK